MADDKAKIDWKMLEASAAEAVPSETARSEATPDETAGSDETPAAAETAAVVASPAAGKIVFHCSNGHRIVVPAKMGGQRGKCSKCGVAVRIPATSEAAAHRPTQAESQRRGVERESAADSAAAEEAVHAGGDDERVGVGGTQQGPDHEDAVPVGQSSSRENMFSGLVTAGDSQVSATEFVAFSAQPPHANAAAGESGPAGPEGLANPTAALVARLFQEVEHGGIVEVHIAGGSVILPEFYESRWSVGSHGLFASRAADDTVTLTAVAWDSIQKIIVRQVNGLPDGMFE
jgi:hypothetical protein